MAPIKFYIGEETSIVVEKKDFDKSLFTEQYKEVFTLIQDVMSHEKDARASNVITVCGDRGEGKSSFLYTVHGIFKSKAIMSEAEKILPKYDFSRIHPIRVIDPSFFDTEHNLVELLLGLMYADLRDYEEKQDEYTRKLSDKTEILKSFHKIKGSLQSLKKKNSSPYDQLEELDELAAAVTVRTELEKLFSAYAQYFGKEKLMICVDDLDLNIEGGYQMAEDIRKYLSQSEHCVVLVALKVDQMTDVVKSYLRGKMNDKMVSDAEVEDMAVRYVTKLLPLKQRVWMPKGNDIVERTLEIMDGEKVVYRPTIVKEAVVELIYHSTRYIFVNGAGVSPIVPLNLRSLRHLIALLMGMYLDEKEDLDNVEKKAIFKNYFYQVWTKCLNKDDKGFVEDFVKTDDVSCLNKKVISYISDFLRKNSITLGREHDLLERIVSPMNATNNISLGDVYHALSVVESIFNDTEVHNFAFFIRAFYSIKLYDLYNVVSQSEKNLYPKIDPEIPSIYKYDQLYQVENYLQRLINGSYFSYNAEDLLPYVQEGSDPRDKRFISADALREYYKSFYHKYEKWDQLDENDQKNLAKHLQLVEFFVLTSVCSDSTKTEKQDIRFGMTPRYLLPFSPTHKKIRFDVLSIFSNIVNIKTAYERLIVVEKNKGKKNIELPNLYKVATECKMSLLNQMYEKCEKKRHDEKLSTLSLTEHGLLSDATIRFSEVQMAILDCLKVNRSIEAHRDESLNTYHISWVYKDIQNLKIALYPVEEDEKRHVLLFNFLTPIINLLTKDFEGEFNKIFGDPSEKKSIEPKKENFVQKVVIAVAIQQSLEKWFGSAFTPRFNFPKSGKQIRTRINRKAKETYDACGVELLMSIFHDNVEFASRDLAFLALANRFDEIKAKMDARSVALF